LFYDDSGDIIQKTKQNEAVSAAPS
jgi:hypothetical protein